MDEVCVSNMAPMPFVKNTRKRTATQLNLYSFFKKVYLNHFADNQVKNK